MVTLLTANMAEIGPASNDVDFEIGKPGKASNDFLIKGEVPEAAEAVCVIGTEYGGIFEYYQAANSTGATRRKGFTWRGLLEQGIIIPPSGSDYRIVSGDANSIIRTILADHLGGFFFVPVADSGIQISSYQFTLYCTILEGLTDMLESVGAKLKIYAEKPAAGAAVRVVVCAQPAETIGDKVSDDYPVDMTYTDSGMGINHLVCMGKGELRNRMRLDLYVNDLGEISRTKYFTGFRERTAYFDYPGAQSADDLEAAGTKKLLTLRSARSLEITKADVDGDIGDRVSGYMHGLATTSPIIKKVLNVSGGTWTYEVKVEGDTA